MDFPHMEFLGNPFSPQLISKIDSAVLKLTKLGNLDVGWDSYNAPRIDPSAIGFAAVILQSLEPSYTQAPHISPTPDGSVQLDWHSSGLVIELYIDKPYSGNLYIRNKHNQTESDRPFDGSEESMEDLIQALKDLNKHLSGQQKSSNSNCHPEGLKVTG